MKSIRIKKCSECLKPFNCGNTSYGETCWCNNYPPLFFPSKNKDCMCENCFKQATILKINAYTETINTENAKENKAKNLPKTKKLIENIDYYLENDNIVFTKWYHLKRGNCCDNNCRNCPYK